MTIAQWLNTLVPMTQIVQVVNQVLPAFVIVAVDDSRDRLLHWSYQIRLGLSSVSQADYAVCLHCWRSLDARDCSANRKCTGRRGCECHPSAGVVSRQQSWMMRLCRWISRSPSGSSANTSLGRLAPAPTGPPVWELNKWADYLTRALFILVTGWCRLHHGLHHASDANHPEINLGLQQTFGADLYCMLESPVSGRIRTEFP